MKRRTTNAVRRLQRGTDNLEPGPLPPEKRLIGPKEKAGLYDPGGTPLEKEYAKQYQEHEALMAQLRKSVYGTIGINIDGQEMEVPLWNKDMTPQQAEEAARDRLEMGLHPFTPEDQLQKAQDDEQARPIKIGFSRGTDNVPALLSPHEAVLNRNAADILGRDKIRKLNAMGNRMPQRLAYGTDDVKDLLRDTEDTFYGGGQAPRPTPKPTPVPRLYAYGVADVEDRDRDYAAYGSGAASSRTVRSFIDRYGLPNSRGNVTTPTPSGGTATVNQPLGYSDYTTIEGGGPLSRYPTSQSQYINKSGTTIGPQYDPITGTVNPLPRGAVGVQGSRNDNAFNRGLNGVQPQQSSAPTAPLTHTQMAEDIARRNLTAAGSLLGATQQGTTSFNQNATPSLYPQRPAAYPITPEGNINFNIPGGSMEDALSRGPSEFYRPSANPVEASNDTGYGSAYGQTQWHDKFGNTPDWNYAQYQKGTNNRIIPPGGGQSNSGVTVDELTKAGIRPGRYADAASPITRSGTGYSYVNSSGGKVDIAGPMHFAKVRRAVEREENQGY